MLHTFGSIDSISVTDEGIFRLSTGLIKYAKISPRGTVRPIQLHGTDVSLQGIHVLVLLLIQYPVSTNTCSINVWQTLCVRRILVN